MTPRRITLQLTPLLDLLMILLFAQFLEVKTVEQQQAEAHQQALTEFQQQTDIYESEANLLTMRLNEARASSLRLQQQSDQLSQSNAQLKSSLNEAVLDIEQLQSQLQSVLRREAQIAQSFNRLMTDVTQNTEQSSEDTTEQLKQLQQIIRQGSSISWVEHLLTYEELRKRCDVWELRLSANGIVSFASGAGAEQVRLGTQQQLTDALFAIFKTWPQPKSMVVIMVSYGDARRVDVKTFQDSIPELTQQIRTDVGIRTQIEYALLGFRPTSQPSSPEDAAEPIVPMETAPSEETTPTESTTATAPPSTSPDTVNEPNLETTD